ncbi:MAG: hypothetical protein U9R48_09040 [Chloroflexota bacterium]|nr:hypothetical protein [Chloroflexota bacterium]
MPRRIALVLMLLFLLSGLAPSAIHAQPSQQQMKVEITSPEMNAELRGMVAIVGSASVPSFQFYKVEFGVGPSPSEWAVIGELHDQPVINGQLAVWDTTKLPDGVYTLRLQAVKQDGNWEEFYVRQLAIVNTRPTPTPTPTVTPTLEPTPTEVREATPEATATLYIIAPTEALSMPTPTPTLSRPDQGRELPLDPKSWVQAFVFGGATMGAIFVLLGIVFGLRRLL